MGRHELLIALALAGCITLRPCPAPTLQAFEASRGITADGGWVGVKLPDDGGLCLTPDGTLDSSRSALNATEPLSKSDFTRDLRRVIEDPSRTNKVFKASE